LGFHGPTNRLASTVEPAMGALPFLIGLENRTARRGRDPCEGDPSVR
jgi:hypothetical protein